MKIAIARLRSRVQYNGPLEHIMDSFYDCLDYFIINNPQHQYLFYNFSFGGKTKKDIDAIKDADVILIPTENEFHAWVPNYLHPLNLAKSNEQIEALKPHFNGKKVILLRNDRADSPELYRDYTLKGSTPSSILCLDEDDFPLGIHNLRHYFMKDHLRQYEVFNGDIPKTKDFVYWGTEKRKLPGGAVSGDERHVVLKAISKAPIEATWIGRFSNIKRDLGMTPIKELVPILAKHNATLCFNWMSNTALTSRYAEAMAVRMIPLVWKDYDSTDRLGITDFQRCESADDVIDKLGRLRHPNEFSKKFIEIENVYFNRLPGRMSTHLLFELKLTSLLET